MAPLSVYSRAIARLEASSVPGAKETAARLRAKFLSPAARRARIERDMMATAERLLEQAATSNDPKVLQAALAAGQRALDIPAARAGADQPPRFVVDLSLPERPPADPCTAPAPPSGSSSPPPGDPAHD